MLGEQIAAWGERQTSLVITSNLRGPKLSMTAEEGECHSEIERIRARIAGLIDGHFSEGATSYYLSQLGNELKEDRKNLERLTRKKVSEFVQDEFQYQIGRTGSHNNVLYIVAPGADPEKPEVTLPRFNKRFWAAFAVPLSDGERRFLDLADFNFGPNHEKLVLDGNEIREIDAKYLLSENEIRAPAQTGEQIKAWADAQNLDIEQFTIARHKRPIESGKTLLTEIITALDKDQLKRVSLPLDVIQTLSSRSR